MCAVRHLTPVWSSVWAEYITTRTHLTVFHTNSLPVSKLADLHTRRVSFGCIFFLRLPLVHALADSSMRRRTPPDLAHRGRARSAPQTPAARTPATCAATGASGERQPGFRQGTCASRCARGAAHRGSRRIAPAATRHARGRSARRPPPSLAADHAAALWQLWCRVGRTTTINCQVVESHALYHRLQRATGAGPGANAGTAQRAGDGGRTYPANQHHVWIHTLSCVRRLTMLVPIGTAFGYGTRTHTLSRTLPGREASRCAVRPQSAAQKRAPRTRLEGDSRARGGRLDRSKGRIRPLERSDSTARKVGFDR